MIKFEPDAGGKNSPINSEGGYYARNLYPTKVHFLFNVKINLFMQWLIIIRPVNMMKVAFLWKDGKDMVLKKK